MSAHEANTPRSIILIGGSGRSGTTVLRRLLGRHPAVCEVPEWRLPVDPGGLVDFYVGVTSAWTPLVYDAHYRELACVLRQVSTKPAWQQLYRRMVHGFGLSRWFRRNMDLPYGAVDMDRFCPDFPRLARALLRDLRSLEYRAFWSGSPWLHDGRAVLGGPHTQETLAAIIGGFYRSVVAVALETCGAEYYLEKNTWYPLVFDRFLELVPEARLVCIRRDPRDVVCSMMRQRWAPSEPVAAARYYRAIMDRWYAVRAKLQENCYLEVYYEELVVRPDEVLGRIAAFTGIQVVPGPYELSTRGVGRWQQILGPAEMGQILPYIAPELKDRGADVS